MINTMLKWSSEIECFYWLKSDSYIKIHAMNASIIYLHYKLSIFQFVSTYIQYNI